MKTGKPPPYAPPVLDDALALLACPHCGEGLTRTGGSVACRNGHSFDVARQGYVSLLPGDARLGSADTAQMVAAREAFLGAGHFAPLGEALAEAAARALDAAAEPPLLPGRCVVDLGAGTAWYLARVLDRLPGRAGLALDLSKHALRRAARAHPRIAAVACDAWRPLPIRDGTAALVLSVFAPRDGAEISRVLSPGGALALAAPTRRHLGELVSALGLLNVDERKRRRLSAKLEPHLRLEARDDVEWQLALDRTGLTNAVAMGPSARHADPEALRRRVAALPEPAPVTASVTISIYRRG